MGCVCRPRLSWREKNELWERWRRGESQSEIARALHRVSSCVSNVVAADGGIAPRPRGRAARALSSQEREEISRGLAHGVSFRAITRRLRRAQALKQVPGSCLSVGAEG